MRLDHLFESDEEDHDFTAKLVGKIAAKYGFVLDKRLDVRKRAHDGRTLISYIFRSSPECMVHAVMSRSRSVYVDPYVNMSVYTDPEQAGEMELWAVMSTQDFVPAGTIVLDGLNTPALQSWSVEHLDASTIGKAADKMFSKIDGWFKELKRET